MMWKLPVALATLCVAMAVASASDLRIRTGEELVSNVLTECSDMSCIKDKVLLYLDNLLNLRSESGRSFKNVDAAIFKRAVRVLKTHEFSYKLPEMLFDDTKVMYNYRNGFDVVTADTESARGILKKKLLLPVLLLLKLKMKALMPIFVAIASFKAFKALVLSKIAIVLVLGFIAVQLLKKSGMPMPMAMMPMPDPMTAYGPPPSASTPPAPSSSYGEPWQPTSGGPYSRVWSSSNDNSESASNLAYSSYFPISSSSSSSSSASTTTRP